MLTERENYLEAAKADGKPDHFVNQFSFLHQIFDPIMLSNPSPAPGQLDVVNSWGVTYSWPDNQPGQVPVHMPESKIVIQDMEDWQEYVHGPEVVFPEAAWEPMIAEAESVDRTKEFVCAVQVPGLFEQSHALGEMKNIMMDFYEYPDEIADLFKYIADWEIRKAEQCIKYLHPDALFRHDDWGSRINTFVSPEMFEEFIAPPTKEIYTYWKENGVQIIGHHSDSYCATIVDQMIDMGIDFWQGVLTTNDLPELVQKYKGQIMFMGGLETFELDVPDWSHEALYAAAKDMCDQCGPISFIPCLTQGGAFSSIPEVYPAMCEEIDKYSKVYFAEHAL